MTTKLLSVATKTTTPGRFVQHAVHGGPVVFARADAGCRLASPAPGSSARALLLRPLLKRHQTRPAVARLPAGPGGRPAIDRAAAEGSAIRRCRIVFQHAAAGYYAREVLDEAYRRAFRDNGIRMQQLGESGADRELITDQFAAIRDELADL